MTIIKRYYWYSQRQEQNKTGRTKQGQEGSKSKGKKKTKGRNKIGQNWTRKQDSTRTK